MALPELNTYDVNENNIQLYWKASPKSVIKRWRIYGAKGIALNFIMPMKGVDLTGNGNPDHAFVKIGEDIPNHEIALTPGSCAASFSRVDLGIEERDPYYFLITSVDKDGVESSISVDDIHAVPFRDAYFVDEAGEPVNVVYKNFEFLLPPTGTTWDADRVIDLTKLLGRTAKQVTMDAVGAEFFVRFNSVNNDAMTIRSSVPYNLNYIRGALKIERIFINNPGPDDVTVRLFVAG